MVYLDALLETDESQVMTRKHMKDDNKPLRPALAAGLVKALEHIEQARNELKAIGETPATFGVQPYDLRRRLGIVAEDIKGAIELTRNETRADRPVFSI